MMRSLFSGVSGLKSHQTRMDVIGNNIANINTIGFKSSRTTFSDMLSQMSRNASAATDTRGGVNPRQIGLGVNVESIDLLFQDASPQQTGKNTDLALAGNGLFVLGDGEQSYYTRNGAFMFDEQGYYVMPGNGLRVQGWNATSDGVLDTNGLATDIIVPTGKTMDAAETTQMTYSGNLNRESRIIERITFTAATGATQAEIDALVTPQATGGEGGEGEEGGGATVPTITSVNVDGQSIIAAQITFKDGTKMNVTDGYYQVNHSVPVTTLATVYDSLGSKHEVTVLIDKDYDSVDSNLTDENARASGSTYYTYTDDSGNEQTIVIPNGDPSIQPEGEGAATTYTYTKTYNVTVGGTEENPTYTYVDEHGQTQTLNEDDEGLDINARTYTVTHNNMTRGDTVYYNRWRVYIAPGVGEAGPASENFANSYERSQENGNPETDGSKTVGTMNNVNYIYFNDRGQFISNGQDENASITFEYSEGNGAASNQAIISFDGLTQYANATSSFPTTNGNAAGILQSIAVDASGIISGTYTNGLIRTEAQIAVAQFTNASGLTKVGTTIYQESNNSGQANVRTVDSFGLTVTASALEMSNVDLATEFADMIITQRGFQANSKMTTVADEMLETVVNMKR